MPAERISKKHQCVADGVFYAELDEVGGNEGEKCDVCSSCTASLVRSVTLE